MALTPLDIIKKHIDQILDAKWLPDGAPGSVELAIELWEELKGNFLIVAKQDPFAPDVEAAAAEQRRIAPDPVPQARQWVDGDATEFTVRATGNPMLWYYGTNLQAIRLDDLTPGDSFPLRERQIALALLDLSANALKDQTL